MLICFGYSLSLRLKVIFPLSISMQFEASTVFLFFVFKVTTRCKKKTSFATSATCSRKQRGGYRNQGVEGV